MWTSLRAVVYITMAVIPRSMMESIPFTLERMQASPIRKNIMVREVEPVEKF